MKENSIIANKIKNQLRKNCLLILTLSGVFIGFIIGVSFRYLSLSSQTIMLIAFPGEMLMRMLKMLILPLFISSIISGISVLDLKSSKKVALVSIFHVVISTFLAAVIGILVAALIKPGKVANLNLSIDLSLKNEFSNNNTIPLTTIDTILDLIRSLFPENIVQSALQQGRSHYSIIKSYNNLTNTTTNKKKWSFVYDNNMNMLGIITFCMIFGMIIGNMGNKAKTLRDFFIQLNDVTMVMMKIFMWYAPIGICFLIAGQILEINDISSTAKGLGLYILTVLLGLAIHILVTIPLIYVLICRKNPFAFYYKMLDAITMGFATSSSSVTMPTIFRCLIEKLDVNEMIVKFVIPVGTTVNMNGTAVYQTVATIFIAQINSRGLSLLDYAIISLTATAASIGAASIPTSIVLSIVIVLQSVGIPLNEISLIFAVDFLVDRFVTVTNLLGNSVTAADVYHLCQEDLKRNKRLTQNYKPVQQNNQEIDENLNNEDIGILPEN